MYEELLKNLELEQKMIIDLRSIHASIKTDPAHKTFYLNSANALLRQIRMINDTIPTLLKAWSPLTTQPIKQPLTTTQPSSTQPLTQTKPLPPQELVTMNYATPTTKEKKYVTINKQDKKEFLEKLKFSEQGLSNIRKIRKEQENKYQDINKPSAYARIANKLFRNFAETQTKNFSGLGEDLKKANMRFLLPTYLAMMFLSITLGLLTGITIYGILLFINLNNWTYFWSIILPPTVIAAGFYLYPASEASSTQKNITQELPFATIHMAAIAGSDISPIKIFKIIASSKEYPDIGREIKKVIARVEFYGNDIVTSLKEVASKTSNRNLSELLSGLATNISTGGALKTFLQKKSENFLLDYKLERQKYIDLAGTFMDVYISVLIAAPLVLMMMFIVMSISGLGIAGLGITALMFISILGIIIINIIFLIAVNMKQPKV